MTHTMDDTRGRKVDFYCLWHEMKKLGGSFPMVRILDGLKNYQDACAILISTQNFNHLKYKSFQ